MEYIILLQVIKLRLIKSLQRFHTLHHAVEQLSIAEPQYRLRMQLAAEMREGLPSVQSFCLKLQMVMCFGASTLPTFLKLKKRTRIRHYKAHE